MRRTLCLLATFGGSALAAAIAFRAAPSEAAIRTIPGSACLENPNAFGPTATSIQWRCPVVAGTDFNANLSSSLFADFYFANNTNNQYGANITACRTSFTLATSTCGSWVWSPGGDIYIPVDGFNASGASPWDYYQVLFNVGRGTSLQIGGVGVQVP
jgi:hypothetical protein